jgi:hypothetical protein
MEESSKWDERLAQKARNRDEAGFSGMYSLLVLT